MIISYQAGSYSPEQNDWGFADGIFICIFMNEKFRILLKISREMVLRCPIDNNSASVQIMTWHQICDKPLYEPMLTQIVDAYVRH